ncbi:MAG: hypothetical protein K2H14_01030, partial [Muribaculaceae bacterium]|nr:hypothetical protein [Muribaculaceae bacterium]
MFIADTRTACNVILRHITILIVMLCSLSCGAASGSHSPDETADTLRGVTLQEIVVKRTKNHYSKRNNPAVDFVSRIRDAREKGDPRRHEYYSYRKYERISLGLNNFTISDSSFSGSMSGKFAFIKEHID